MAITTNSLSFSLHKSWIYHLAIMSSVLCFSKLVFCLCLSSSVVLPHVDVAIRLVLANGGFTEWKFYPVNQPVNLKPQLVSRTDM